MCDTLHCRNKEERKVQMCAIFLRSLFLSGAKAVKMCTGLSALVHWAASSYFAFSIKFQLQWSSELLQVIMLFSYFFIIPSHLSLFIFLSFSLSLTSSCPSSFSYSPLFLSLWTTLRCGFEKIPHFKIEKDLLQLFIPAPTLCCGQF